MQTCTHLHMQTHGLFSFRSLYVDIQSVVFLAVSIGNIQVFSTQKGLCESKLNHLA